jgi:hypothetical protein
MIKKILRVVFYILGIATILFCFIGVSVKISHWFYWGTALSIIGGLGYFALFACFIFGLSKLFDWLFD